MNGFTDLKNVCQSLTDKPLMVINTHCHSHDYDDISLLRSVYHGALEILEGKTEKDGPYKWFEGEGLYHPFSVPEGKHFQQDDYGICYSKENIR